MLIIPTNTFYKEHCAIQTIDNIAFQKGTINKFYVSVINKHSLQVTVSKISIKWNSRTTKG